MTKVTSIFLLALAALPSCAHEMDAHKDVAEEKLVFAPDAPASDAGSDKTADDDATADESSTDNPPPIEVEAGTTTTP